jgi:hypothetical protein
MLQQLSNVTDLIHDEHLGFFYFMLSSIAFLLVYWIARNLGERKRSKVRFSNPLFKVMNEKSSFVRKVSLIYFANHSRKILTFKSGSKIVKG